MTAAASMPAHRRAEILRRGQRAQHGGVSVELDGDDQQRQRLGRDDHGGAGGDHGPHAPRGGQAAMDEQDEEHAADRHGLAGEGQAAQDHVKKRGHRSSGTAAPG
jgi:hypothetical protein